MLLFFEKGILCTHSWDITYLQQGSVALVHNECSLFSLPFHLPNSSSLKTSTEATKYILIKILKTWRPKRQRRESKDKGFPQRAPSATAQIQDNRRSYWRQAEVQCLDINKTFMKQSRECTQRNSRFLWIHFQKWTPFPKIHERHKIQQFTITYSQFPYDTKTAN